MKRVTDLLGSHTIGSNGHWNIGCFERHDNIVKIKLFQDANMEQGAFNHCLRSRIAVLLQQMILQ
ncbi:hypothetical protein D3C85_1491700 [compost metagenome]